MRSDGRSGDSRVGRGFSPCRPTGLARRPDPRRRAISEVAVVALVFAVSAPAGAGPVSGTVRTETREGIAPARAVVYAEPLDGRPPRRVERATLTQRHRAFLPAVLAVPVGSTVDFPNEDVIFHNVFSLSTPMPFDLGLYRAGESRSRTFTRAGTYRVFCNIHPQMTAFIVVAPTPWVTMADPQGAYRLELPPGRYRLTAISERAVPVVAEVTVGTGTTTAPVLELDESAFVSVPHKNKHGHDYPASAYDPTRK